MGLYPLITFMHVLSDSFSSPFKRFKPYQDHIFVFAWFIVGFSRYRPRNVRFTFQSRFQSSDLEILRVFVPSDIEILKTIVLSYSCGLLIASFQISSLSNHRLKLSGVIFKPKFTDRLTREFIMGKIIGRAPAWRRK